MFALLSAILIASLLGSLHCAGMCGPFVALAVAGPCDTAGGRVHASRKLLPRQIWTHCAYHGGRLITYSLMGSFAGAVGAALDLGGALMGVQRAAALFAGALMLVMGVGALAQIAGVGRNLMILPGFATRWIGAAHRGIASLPEWPRAAAIGLLTSLLPCGWLYAFVITAAGTADPFLGAACMAAFWLGTVPVLASVGIGIHALAAPLRRHIPLVTSLVLIGIGGLTMWGRLHLPAAQLARVAATPQSVDGATQQAASLSAEEMPCCHGESK